MKIFPALAILVFTLIVVETSCTKKDALPISNPERSIQFILHTEKDFSNNNDNITFSIFIRTHTKSLLDSTLPSMKIKDVPGSINKLIFEKKVPNDDGSDLGVGFHYTIENVGSSSFVDSCKAGQAFKVVDFSFK